MSHLMNMRKAYKEDFEKKHGIKLGFMSCFVKASADALREMPAVNGCEFRLQYKIVRTVHASRGCFLVWLLGKELTIGGSGARSRELAHARNISTF